MQEIVRIINFFPIMGRGIFFVIGGMLIFLGIDEAVTERRAEPLKGSVIGFFIILLEIFIPIAIINGIVALCCTLLFLLLILIAFVS